MMGYRMIEGGVPFWEMCRKVLGSMRGGTGGSPRVGPISISNGWTLGSRYNEKPWSRKLLFLQKFHIIEIG
jgi:hypothetical protein